MISKNPTCIVNWQTSMALPRNRSATFAPFSTTSATSVSTGSSMPVFPTTSCWNCCPTSKPATTSISAGSSPTTPMCPPFRIHRRYRLVQGKQSQRTHSGLLQPVVRCRFASENTRRRWYGRHYLSIQCHSRLPGAHTAYRSDPCRGQRTTPHGDGTGLPAFGRLSLTRQSAGSLRLVCHPFPASKRYFGFPGAETFAIFTAKPNMKE